MIAFVRVISSQSHLLEMQRLRMWLLHSKKLPKHAALPLRPDKHRKFRPQQEFSILKPQLAHNRDRPLLR